MLGAVRCLLTCALLQLGSAWSINCSARPSSPFSDQTTYNISGLRVPDGTQRCEYFWEKNNHVLARDIANTSELVVNHSITDLITLECFEDITYKLVCMAQEFVVYQDQVNCQINCTLAALERSQKLKEITATVGGATVGGATVGGATVGATVGGATAIILLLVLCVYLAYKFKDKIFRMFDRCHSKCLHNNAKKQNVDSRAAEWEAGNV